MLITEDPQRIEYESVNFFEALLNGRQDENLEDTGQTFQPDYTYLEEYLETLSQLSEASQESIVEPLSCDEVKDVLKNCKNGKSPGLDGLTYQFYKTTWSTILTVLTKVLQTQLNRDRLMESSRHGATRLIPKVQEVPDVTELRPITLLQVEY